jgi:hypothetical protein
MPKQQETSANLYPFADDFPANDRYLPPFLIVRYYPSYRPCGNSSKIIYHQHKMLQCSILFNGPVLWYPILELQPYFTRLLLVFSAQAISSTHLQARQLQNYSQPCFDEWFVVHITIVSACNWWSLCGHYPLYWVWFREIHKPLWWFLHFTYTHLRDFRDSSSFSSLPISGFLVTKDEWTHYQLESYHVICPS